MWQVIRTLWFSLDGRKGLGEFILHYLMNFCQILVPTTNVRRNIYFILSWNNHSKMWHRAIVLFHFWLSYLLTESHFRSLKSCEVSNNVSKSTFFAYYINLEFNSCLISETLYTSNFYKVSNHLVSPVEIEVWIFQFEK